ncbi:hypothetical protein EV356DRAFT_532571 [Viridothelium virens]|uniref:Rhodopsin domain-containing protein n=1 Tax=Viridothelium virens TaxID=1048519 RepID=A0A6A6HAC4_VIRVR|nr:hypothetical protein EV356DRAFT_532571 [Viridothelium virens]
MLLPLSKSIVAGSIILMSLAICAVTLRLFTRRKRKVSIRADDWMIVFCLIVAVGLCITTLYAGATNLFARPIPSLTLEEYHAHEKIIWVNALLGFIVYAVVKFSILLFYKRIFDLRRFHLAANVVFVIVAAWMVAAIFAQIFSANPVDNWWTSSFDFTRAFDYEIFLFAMSIIDIFLDLTVLVLPIRVIAHLHMDTTKKVALIGTFGLGFFCVVSSAVRTWYNWELHLVVAGKTSSYNITSVSAWGVLWADIEACSSIVTACLPTIAPLFAGSTLIENLLRSVQSYVHRSGSLLSLMRFRGSSRGDGSSRVESSRAKQESAESIDGKRAWVELQPYQNDASVTRVPSNTMNDEENLLQHPTEAIRVDRTYEMANTARFSQGY